MKQNTAILPSKSCVGPGVVDIDFHHCLAQLLTMQHVIDLDLKVKGRAWRKNIKVGLDKAGQSNITAFRETK